MNRCYHSYLCSSFVNCLVNIKFVQVVQEKRNTRYNLYIDDSKLLILKFHQGDTAKLNYLENQR